MTASRRTVGWLCAIVLAGAGPAATVATAAVPACHGGVQQSATWNTSKTPLYEQEHETAGALDYRTSSDVMATDSADPRHVYVSNGQHVFRSLDGGCTWQLTWSLSYNAASNGGAFAAGLTRVISIHSVRDHVYLTVGDRHDSKTAVTGVATNLAYVSVPQPLWIIASDRIGDPWRVIPTGIVFKQPDINSTPGDGGGIYDPLLVSPSAPDVLYLRIPVVDSSSATTQLYRSGPVSGVWVPRALFSPTPSTTNPTAVNVNYHYCCVVDPQNPDELWAADNQAGLLHSVDGGASFAVVPGLGASASYTPEGGSPLPWSYLRVFHAAGRPAQIVVGRDREPIRKSDDGGRTFYLLPRFSPPLSPTGGWKQCKPPGSVYDLCEGWVADVVFGSSGNQLVAVGYSMANGTGHSLFRWDGSGRRGSWRHIDGQWSLDSVVNNLSVSRLAKGKVVPSVLISKANLYTPNPVFATSRSQF
jgi:hypothetical protein